MKKYAKTKKFLRKPVVSKALISIVSNGKQKIISYNKLSFDQKAIKAVIINSSISCHNE